MADERNQRLDRIRLKFHRLSVTPEELLPAPNILKNFIRDLQQDIKDEAKHLMAEESFEDAFNMLCNGINCGGFLSLDGYSCDTTNDARLLILRAECANKMGAYVNALQDARKAMNISPNSIPAKVECVKAFYSLFKTERFSDLIPLEIIALNRNICEAVRDNPEVKDIIGELDDYLQHVQHKADSKTADADWIPSHSPHKADSKTAFADWIPSHNKVIAKNNKRAKEKSSRQTDKRRKIKEISDGAEPIFPEIKPSPSSTSPTRNNLPKLGAKPKKPTTKTQTRSAPVTSSASTKHSQKLDDKVSVRKEGRVKPSAHSSASAKKAPTFTKATGNSFTPPAPQAKLRQTTIPSFPHRIKYVCGLCFKRQGGADIVDQRPGSSPPVCAGPGSHVWKQCRAVVVYCASRKRWCKVKRRHEKLQSHTSPKLCTRPNGEACTRTDCWFPHFKEEVDLWVYMGKHKLKTLDDVMSAGPGSEQVMNKDASSSPSSKPSHAIPSQPPRPSHHCSYCKTSYTEPWQLEQHIQTPDHWSKVNTDADKEWKWRSPPWNVVNGRYQECQESKQGSCMFSAALNNNCTKAHSLEELKEWEERHQYRMMKMKKAKEKKLYAFMDEVLDKFNFSPSGEDVIAEKLPGIRIECSQDFARFLDTKKELNSTYTCTWSFTFEASENKFLKRVCLFYDDNRLHFKLSQPANESEAQVCPGNLIVETDGKTFKIDVIFRSQILGSFSQWVLFDLGTEPFLVRKLQVQVGSATQHETFNEMLKEQNTKVEVWNNSNREIVRFFDDDHKLTSREEELLVDYQAPLSPGIDDLGELSRDNYREYMHRMLYVEEQECNNKISQFAKKSCLKCHDSILLETPTASVVKYAVDGSKYGFVNLQRVLMDDSETSQIIERSVQKIMLKFCNREKIYEAIILPDQGEVGKQNQDTLYIKLSPTCVEELKLKSDAEYQVEIQLQLNRLPFCYMHSSVDRLQNMDVVFPSRANPQKLPSLSKQVQSTIDAHQDRVVRFISDHGRRKAHRLSGVGPVLVCGPFGTGKTHTLATAVHRTLESRPDSKILICTHSNSAADLYITEHFHEIAEKGGIGKMIRVYAKYRDIKTINETVRRYVFIKDYQIQIPTVNEIKACSVVITTLTTSHRLESSELHGHFTHILIDEAGQALETEVLQPLTLATGNTCVVLAGDHIQMCPKVFSRTARHAKFHTSLLERLFYRKVSRVLLSSNYRTCQKMLDFISNAFYSGTCTNQHLQAVVAHEPHPRYKHPLVFSTVKGEDQKIGMSYVNHYEVHQILEIVKVLHDDWPEQWGTLDANSICVITPYKMQVRQIRTELRKHRLGNIGVETVQNVQGKQFRVLIISTVRTRTTLNKVDTTAFVSKISPANRPDDTFDYGFLSDPRLLNTACTRAQSLLMVVGNPLALCSVGECSKIWRRYLKECEENYTLLPLGTTVAGIQQEMEAARLRLNPCAADFQPAASSPSKHTAKVNTKEHKPTLEAPIASSHKSDVDSWLPDDETTIPDGIMRELYRQISQDQSRLKRSTEETGVVSETGMIPEKWKGKPPKFRMIEQSDRIVLDIHFNERTQTVGAEKDDEESDSDEGLRNDKHDEGKRQVAYRQVKQRGDKYKICSFHCEKSGQTYAVPLDEGLSGRISITSKRRRGRALNLDEVIVEILDDMDESGAPEKKNKYGKVICICKRAARSALMSEVVCKLDEHMDNQMVPIDRTLPKFFVLTRDEEQKRLANASRTSPDFSTVSVYHYRRELQEDSPFLRNVEVSRNDRKHKLFIVKYVKWFADAPYPMGVVTEELPKGDDKDTGLRILKLTHGVKDEWKPEVIKEVEEKFPDKWEIPDEEIKTRYDARSLITFTIDPPECQDLDDALSVDKMDTNYQVGIHIADVAYFVSKDKAIDKEARNRSTTFYPSFAKPINMLPPQLSNKFCSLLPEQDRLTISVFVTLDENGSVIDVKIMPSVIRSRCQLTYDTVEKVIKMTCDKEINNVNIEEKILTLSKLAKERRSIRLGSGRFAFSHDAEEDEAQHPLAHSLVEEMMLLANEEVAKLLVKTYPDCSPLRRQLAPSDENIKDWLGRHSKELTNSLDLQSRFLPTDGRYVPNNVHVHVLKEKWDQLRVAVAVTGVEAQDQLTRITDLITSDENYPQLAVAKADFFKIQEVANYISTGDHPESTKRRHHTLDTSAYTHFTSPIRRYFDIVVHRMLIAAINDDKARNTLHQSEQPYTTTELASISHHCNIQLINSRGFEKKTRALQCALRLREAPQSFKVFVGGFSDSRMELIFPYRRFLPSMCPLKFLKPISKPEINDDSSRMELKWKERIYELHGSTSPKPRLVSSLTLDTENTIVKISTSQWQEILNGVKAEDVYMIQIAVTDADIEQLSTESEKAKRQKQRCFLENQNLPVKEITCETSDSSKPSPYVKFQRGFERGDVVQVQLNASFQKGLLEPSVQLFYLTPKLSLCAEHRVNAIESFAKVAAHRPPANIESIERYQALWLPILKMISAYGAVVSDNSTVIHDIDIKWRCTQGEAESREFSGVFMLKQTFCSDRNFGMHNGDYLCIRYKDLPLAPETKHSLLELTSTSSQSSKANTWMTTFVAHAFISGVDDIRKNTDEWTIAVDVQVNQRSAPFPDVLLGSKNIPTCTVELIPKANSDNRLESAVRYVHDAEPLVQEICLHKIPKVNISDPVIRRLFEAGREIKTFVIQGSPFPLPNESQQAALRLALQQQFTIIQGPPGTGKTVTGAHLTYFFTEVNKQLLDSGRGPPQVLYCGPSNKSVDVVADYLLRLGISAIRVYNSMIEQQDYPIPGQLSRTSKSGSSQEAKMDPRLRSMSLHHLIREKSNRESQSILKYEQLFETPGYKITFDDLDGYRRTIRSAEAEELQKYKVVLCTCNEAGSMRIQLNVNVIQCIVDEAGMCNEPETLIPLVGTIKPKEDDRPNPRKKEVKRNPRQVVLIGDHKQLRPIILERTAVQLGMETSLLEKYGKEAKMLTIQYRMHESICAFPSEAFYKGKLVTADSVKRRPQRLNRAWPGGPTNPLVFCHHIGVEEKQSVRTEDGGEQSRGNPQEVQHVVRIAKLMVNRLGVKQDRIVILTQYRLQRAKIAEELKTVGLKNITVSTVITSQGREWNYVIMSTVRSLPRVEIDEKPSTAWKKRNLGFICDENQINVAITRPKLGLIILGNKYLLKVHSTWKNLLTHYHNKNALVDAKDFPKLA